MELATELGGATLKQSKQNYLKVHRRLSDGIDAIDPDTYDIILIDCPPNFNVVTKTAIVASDYILIPAKPDYLSTLGIDYLQRSVTALVTDFNEYAELDNAQPGIQISPEILGVVFTMVSMYGGQPISAMRPFIAQTKRLGVPVFSTFIRENKSLFGDAPQSGVPVVLVPQSSGTYKEVLTELESLTTEFLQKIEG
ncbi:ParA family protein [Longimicrobium sp.]|uniref:ParA family protein n=1 Tax=Longimicrobium sp. TaxID=2029185 RepID=UPI002F91EECE